MTLSGQRGNPGRLRQSLKIKQSNEEKFSQESLESRHFFINIIKIKLLRYAA